MTFLAHRLALRRIAPLLALALVADSARPQTLLWTAHGPSGSEIGESLTVAGDLNADGVSDILVGNSHHQLVAAFSGVGGEILFELGAPTGQMLFGYSLAGGADLDGDHVPDFIVGAPYGNSAFVYSGADRQLIRVHAGPSLGSAVEFLGDLNGDGIADYAVGASGSVYQPAQVGYAKVFDGSSGSMLWGLAIAGVPDGFGAAITAVPDVDADGVDDFAISAPFASTRGLAFNGALRMYSGATGAVLWAREGEESYQSLGRNLASMEQDLDGDGNGDFLAYSRHSRLAGPNRCSALSGATGEDIVAVEGTSNSQPWDGQEIDSIRDLDGDGKRDIILANPIQGGGRVVLGSSATGEHLFEVKDTTGGIFFSVGWGCQAAEVGDLDGDGYEEWAITSIADGPPGENSGSVWVYSLRPLYAHGSAVSVSTTGAVSFDLSGGMHRAGDLYLVLAGISGSHPAFFLSGGLTKVPLQPDIVTELSIAYPNVPPFIDTLGNLDPVTGFATCAFDISGIPGIGAAVGLQVTYVYIVRSESSPGGSLVWDFASNPQTLEITP